MKRHYPPSYPDRPGGEPIDALLGGFFRAEMPSPWPAFRPPAPVRLPFAQARATRRPTYAGRLALAASVGLLFAGTWLLPTRPAPLAPRGETLRTIGPASAGRGGLLPVHLQPRRPGTPAPDKVKSSLHLEQGSDGRTGIKITVEEVPPPE